VFGKLGNDATKYVLNLRVMDENEWFSNKEPDYEFKSTG
jgi:hypothetical protein